VQRTLGATDEQLHRLTADITDSVCVCVCVLPPFGKATHQVCIPAPVKRLQQFMKVTKA